MMPDAASLTSFAWGPWRLSAAGDAIGLDPERVRIDRRPTLESQHGWQSMGATQISNMTFDAFSDLVVGDLLAAQAAKTQYPHVVFVRGTAGGECHLVNNVGVAEVPNAQQPNTEIVRTLGFTPGNGSQYRYQSNGLLFDHTIAHAAGVSAPVNGAAVQVGARSGTQTEVAFLGSLHSPAGSWTTFDATLESASDSGFTADLNDEVVFTQITTSAANQVATITGAQTNQYRRLKITAVAGTYYPVCCVWIF